MAMKQSNPDGIDDFITFSKINKEKYNDDGTIHFWNGIKVKNDNEDKFFVGFLIMWAKECDKDTYCIHFNPFLSITEIEKGALSIANKISYDLRKHSNILMMIFIVMINKLAYGLKLKNPVKL